MGTAQACRHFPFALATLFRVESLYLDLQEKLGQLNKHSAGCQVEAFLGEVTEGGSKICRMGPWRGEGRG